MNEVWKDIKDYEGLYQVSNFGRVKNAVTGKILKPIQIKTNGKYTQVVVNLYNNGKRKRFTVARLVAQAFIPNPENKPEVDHINTDSTDNRVENLRWVTCKEQHNNPLTKQHLSEAKIGNIPWDKGVKFTDEHCQNISNALKGKYCGSKNPNSKPILQFTKDGQFIKEWDCIKSAVEALGIPQPSISMVITGHRMYAGGYAWKYKTP